MLIVLVFLIAILVFIKVVGNEIFVETINFRKEIAEKKARRENLLSIVHDLENLEEKKERTEKYLAELKENFSVQVEDAALTVALGELAFEGMNISSMLPEEHYENGHYYLYPYTIEFLGAYPALVSFIMELEQDSSGGLSFFDIRRNEVGGVLEGYLTWNIYSLFENQHKSSPVASNTSGKNDLFEIPKQFAQQIAVNAENNTKTINSPSQEIKKVDLYSFPEKTKTSFNESY